MKGDITLAGEFTSTMQQLVAEAEKTIPAPVPREHVHDAGASEINGELATLHDRLTALERLTSSGFEKLTAARPTDDNLVAAQMQTLDEHLIELRKTESVNQRLFNSMHQELKDYRDNFLRDSLQKPFIRDLVVLFDDLSTLSAQMLSANGAGEGKQGAIGQWSDNLENSIHSLLEILHRMEVTEIEPKEMVDRACHRVVSYEPADFAEDDGRVVMRVKRGFVWRNQVLRPEEVVAKRFS